TVTLLSIRLDMTIDYQKTQKDLIARRHEISERQKAIIADKARLDKEYQELQQELVSVDHMLEGLNFMKPGSPPPDFEDLGFAAKVEMILKQTPIHLFPTQIRDELVEKGTKGSSPKNLLISIHNVLTRNEKFLDVQEIDGRSTYKWKHLGDSGGLNLSPFGGIAFSFNPQKRHGRRTPANPAPVAALAGVDPNKLWGRSSNQEPDKDKK